MSLVRYEHLSGEEARQILTARRLAILPIGAIEAHGPHLPVGPQASGLPLPD
ncbi:creatininase family protein [Thermoflexus hugenholtzii]